MVYFFQNLYICIKNFLGSSSLLHSISVDDKQQQEINEKRDKLISKADQGDIIKFGMIPEIVGRFPIIVPFHSLNKEMLVRVLTEPRNSILAQMKLHFSMDEVRIKFFMKKSLFLYP